MDAPKRKRGRPKKIQLPEEIQSVVDKVKQKQQEEEIQEAKDFKEILDIEKSKRKDHWDIPADSPIEFFDTDLSYEISGYRPIDEKRGLDFNPDDYTVARDTYKRTGHYCSFHFGTKAYRDFWNEEYRRCREGYTVNGYTVTGDHYFFLNYYQLKDSRVQKAGTARVNIFPRFMQAQYEFFHYYELCKIARKNVCMMKSRAVGFSEIIASLCANEYSCFRNSITMITAPDETKLNKTLEKVWQALTFLNDHTDGGFFKLRQAQDSAKLKRASFYKYINGQKVEDGFMSQIEGIVADKPSKVRGDRAEIVVFEEAGSNGNLETSYVQGEALVNVGGNKLGILIAGGTGGDSGPKLEGLRKMYYEPDTYDVLKFRHNMNDTAEYKFTGFFVPAYKALDREELVDNRGVCNIEKCKEYYNQERAKKANTPSALVKYCAEYCFTAEEAFNLEGENKFNKVLITEQLTKLRLFKETCPKIETGFLDYTFKGNSHKRENINGFKWTEHVNGKVKILEHPLWTLGEIETGEYDEEKQEFKKESVSQDKINNLYVAGIDGIDIGMAQTSEATKTPSDFCMVIFKRVYGNQDPKIVAIYKDRPQDIREAYKTAMKLAQYYNCMINIEATRMSMVTWARNEKFIGYFMRRPRATLADVQKGKTNTIGTPATNMVIEHQTDLIADYVEDYCHQIWFEEILDELNRYTFENKTKFDIVAALGMVFLADEEISGVVPRQIQEANERFEDIGYYKDENGYTKWGVIPKKDNKPKVGWTMEQPVKDFISSNPMYL